MTEELTANPPFYVNLTVVVQDCYLSLLPVDELYDTAGEGPLKESVH